MDIIRRTIAPLRLHRTVNGVTRVYDLIGSISVLTDDRVKHYNAPEPIARTWNFSGAHTGAYGSAVKLGPNGSARVG